MILLVKVDNVKKSTQEVYFCLDKAAEYTLAVLETGCMIYDADSRYDASICIDKDCDVSDMKIKEDVVYCR